MESFHHCRCRPLHFGEGCMLPTSVLGRGVCQRPPRPDREQHLWRMRLDQAAEGTLHPARPPVVSAASTLSSRISVNPPAPSSPLEVDAKGVPKAAAPFFFAIEYAATPAANSITVAKITVFERGVPPLLQQQFPSPHGVHGVVAQGGLPCDPVWSSSFGNPWFVASKAGNYWNTRAMAPGRCHTRPGNRL